jgi:hypothetical protein
MKGENDMLDSFIVVGLTIVIVNIIKTAPCFGTARGKLVIPLLVFFVAGLLNVVNAVVFSGEMLVALRDGLVLGAAASGIYSMGKKKLEPKIDA